MVARWTIQFATITGSDGLIVIYDADYTGEDTISLIPTSNPISISMHKEDMLTPVMSDSGYLRIVNDGNPDSDIDDIYPGNAMDRPVVLYIDGVITWRGYISPEAYSADYTASPVVVEFPLVGVLNALGAFNITDTGVGLQLIADFIKQCLLQTGFTWEGLIFPRQLLEFDDFSNAGELRLELSRYNFLHENTSDNVEDADWTPFIGDSYLSILQNVCQYFGWTASQQGTYLLLSTPRTDIEDYVVVDYENLEALVLNPSQDFTVEPITRPIVTPPAADGTAHRRSRSNGYKRVTLLTNLNPGMDIVPQINYNGNIEKTFNIIIDVSQAGTQDYLHAQDRFLDITHENIILHAYRMNGSTYQEVDWALPTLFADYCLPQAYLVKASSWKEEEHITDYSYRNYLRISADKTFNLGGHFAYNVPMASITSRGIGEYHAGCAIAINATVFNSFMQESGLFLQKDTYGMTQWGPFNNNLRVSLKIGNKYYKPSTGTWVARETIFEIPAGVKTEDGEWTDMTVRAQGSILNTKTLDMPWDGASGFIIPVTETLMGTMTLTFFPWIKNHSMGEDDDFTALFIGDLDVSYYSDSTRRDSEGIRIMSFTGRDFSKDYEIKYNLTSLKDDRIGHGLLWYDGTPIGQTIELTYPGEQTLYQPERWAMQTLLKLYSKPSEKLTLETEYSSTLKLYDLIQINDKNYIITGIDTDFADDHTTLTVINYE